MLKGQTQKKTRTLLSPDPGLIQYVLMSWFSGPGCCSGPGFHLRLEASQCSPRLAFCFMGPRTFAWICCPQAPLPRVQKRDSQHMFLQHRGSPTTTLKALWCICIFHLFPLKRSVLGYTQTSFLPVEALKFSELKTPLVYTFSPKKLPLGTNILLSVLRPSLKQGKEKRTPIPVPPFSKRPCNGEKNGRHE